MRISSFIPWIEENGKVESSSDALWPLSHVTSFAVTFVIIACFILPIAFTYMKYLSQRKKETNMAIEQIQITSADSTPPRIRVAHINRIAAPRISAYPGLSRSTVDEDTSISEPPPSYDSLFPSNDNKPRY